VEIIRADSGKGITYLEQDHLGVTNTIILSTAQFGAVAMFLSNPNTARFRATDPGLDTVVVDYSLSDQSYKITQGNITLSGNRKNKNCGFSGIVLWMHRSQTSGVKERLKSLLGQAARKGYPAEVIAEMSGVSRSVVQQLKDGSNGTLQLEDAQKMLDFFSVELSSGQLPELSIAPS